MGFMFLLSGLKDGGFFSQYGFFLRETLIEKFQSAANIGESDGVTILELLQIYSGHSEYVLFIIDPGNHGRTQLASLYIGHHVHEGIP